MSAMDTTTPPRRHLRFHLTQRATLALVAALIALGALAALWHLRPVTLTAPAASAAPDTSASASAVVSPANAPLTTEPAAADTKPPAIGAVIVYVTGAVHTPGLYQLAENSRIADAITAAGEFTANADIAALNLARIVADGEHVHVPEPGQRAIGGQNESAAEASGPVNLNRANAAALQTLPGIGPALAERIITHRETHGEFTSVEQLVEVSGIGPAILANIAELVVAP